MAEYTPRTRAGTTELSPGLRVWNEIDGELTNYHGFDLRALIRLHGRRFELDELTVIRRDDGEQITGSGLRHLQPPTIIRSSIKAHANHLPQELSDEIAFLNADPGTAVAFGAIPAEAAVQARSDGPIDSTLRLVGRVYTIAYAVQDRPAKAVAAAFAVSQATANVWIARAKSAGYIAGDDDE